MIQSAQIRPRQKPRKSHTLPQPQLIPHPLQRPQQRSLTRNRKRRQRMHPPKRRKRMQRIIQALLLNQPARLHQPPRPIRRLHPLPKRERLQWNPCPIHPQLLRRTPQRQQPLQQTVRPRQHQRHRLQQLPQPPLVTRIIRPRLHIHPVKRHHTRLRPSLQKRQQMHPRMPEVNMHQIHLPPLQQSRQHPILAPIHNRRLLLHILQPEPPHKMTPHLRQHLHPSLRHWKQFLTLTLLRHHHRLPTPQPRDLPINMQHLRLQKGRAVRSYSHEKGNPTLPMPRPLSTTESVPHPPYLALIFLPHHLPPPLRHPFCCP